MKLIKFKINQNKKNNVISKKAICNIKINKRMNKILISNNNAKSNKNKTSIMKIYLQIKYKNKIVIKFN